MSPRLHRWVQEMNFRNNSLNVQSDFGKKTLAPYFSEFSITHRLVAQICLSIIVHHIPIDLFFSHKKFPLFFPLPSIVCVCVFFLKITYYFGISKWRQHAFYSIMCEVQSISCYLGLLLWPLFFFQKSDGNAALIMYAFIEMIKWNNLLVFTGLLWILSRQIRKAHLNIDVLNLW